MDVAKIDSRAIARSAPFDDKRGTLTGDQSLERF